jgi:hypothetical protein
MLIPSELIIIGDMIEFIIKAGNVESIPAINIHSPCLFVVFSPKYSFEVAHQAKTGVEKPINQAGIAIIRNSSIDRIEELNNNGNIHRVEIIVPKIKIIHKCLRGGTSNGPVL